MGSESARSAAGRQPAQPRIDPAAGWVQPGETVHCDACGRRIFCYDLHHLVPIAWGGSDSRLAADRQVVWVRLDGDCHATVHMILDHCQKVGAWDDLWINSHDGLPHLIVETARRGWNNWKKATFEGGTA